MGSAFHLLSARNSGILTSTAPRAISYGIPLPYLNENDYSM